MEKAQASRMLSCSVVGSPETVREGVRRLVEETGADELIVAAAIHDHDARLRSYEILAEAVGTSGDQPLPSAVILRRAGGETGGPSTRWRVQ
jgi:hypothetical protein